MQESLSSCAYRFIDIHYETQFLFFLFIPTNVVENPTGLERYCPSIENSFISLFLLRGGGEEERKIKRQGCPSLSRLLDVMIPRCRTVVHVLIEEDYDLQQLYEINDK